MTDIDQSSDAGVHLESLSDQTIAAQRMALAAQSAAIENEIRASFQPRSDADFSEVGLIRRATPLVDAFAGRLPLPRELSDIREHFGVEIAQTVFTQTLERLPVYAGLIRRVRGFEARKLANLRERASQFEVTIVRSALPIKGLEWGVFAERWQAWARALGFTTDIIDTHEANDVRANAKIISNYLFSNPHPRRILVTYGQGAAEFRSLLTTRMGRRGSLDASTASSDVSAAAELASICAWINVAGAYNGAAVARHFNDSWVTSLKVELSRYFGRSTIRERAQRMRELDPRLPAWRQQPVFPDGMQVINVMGLPMRGQLPLNLMVSFEEIASAIGPNDGAISIYDSIAHPGLIMPVVGMTHQIEGVKFEPIFKRLLAIVVEDADLTTDLAMGEPLNPQAFDEALEVGRN